MSWYPYARKDFVLPIRLICLGCALTVAFWMTGNSVGAEANHYIQLTVPDGMLRAFVAPSDGGILASLQVRDRDGWRELLYRGMRRLQKGLGQAPILWPAVGRNYVEVTDNGSTDLKSGWELHGKTYPITIHGFARDLPWTVVDHGTSGKSAFVTLTLRDNAETRRSYPFGFVLTTRYEISGDMVLIRQTVRADPANDESMPFSIGNHVTFRLPLVPGSDAGQTTIETPATRQVLLDDSLRPSGQLAKVDFAKPRELSSFKANAPISLSGYVKGKEWVRLTDPSGLTVEVSHSEDSWPEGAPVLFNLWGNVQQGYFAPEPWVGKQNSLSSKDGVIWLSPGDTFHWTIRIRLSSPD